MELHYRNVLPVGGLTTAAHANVITPPGTTSDSRNSPRMHRPVNSFDLSSAGGSGMEKLPPITGKRRGGSRKACNECKQQKVS